MCKFLDDLFNAFVIIFGCIVLLVIAAVAYYYYPTTTTVFGVIFGLGLLSPILLSVLNFLSRGINKLLATDEVPKWLQAKNPPLDKLQQRLWRSFKDGYNKAGQ